MTTYSALVQDVQDWAEDDGTEFVAEIPLMITRAEESIFRAIPEALVFNKENTGTLTLGTKTLSPGVSMRRIRDVSITVGSITTYLDRRTESFIDLFTPDSSVTGVPKFYSQTVNETVVFAPTPDSAYAYKIKYKALPTGLSSGNTSTWFSVNQYDLLLSATLVEASLFKEDDESSARFMKSFAEKISLFSKEVVSTYRNEDTTGV